MQAGKFEIFTKTTYLMLFMPILHNKWWISIFRWSVKLGVLITLDCLKTVNHSKVIRAPNSYRPTRSHPSFVYWWWCKNKNMQSKGSFSPTSVGLNYIPKCIQIIFNYIPITLLDKHTFPPDGNQHDNSLSLVWPKQLIAVIMSSLLIPGV